MEVVLIVAGILRDGRHQGSVNVGDTPKTKRSL